MASVRNYVEQLATSGRYHFTVEDVIRATEAARPSALAGLRRLESEGVVAKPHRGFYVVVPYEYRVYGCLPPEQFIPQLMDHLGEVFHVALLTAAAFHGAAHQQPQAFQVMVAAPRRALRCGRSTVLFTARKGVSETPVATLPTRRGPCRISTPEATAIELVGYPEQCASLDNVATVLSELAPLLNVASLVEALPLFPITWIQRLGFLLQLVEAPLDLDRVAAFVADRGAQVAPLVRSHSRSGVPRDARWRVLVNAEVEPDV